MFSGKQQFSFVMHSPHPNNIDTMNEPNNTNNGYVRSFPDDFNFDNTNPPVHMPINLHAQNFPSSASDNVDMTSMDIMDYGNISNYTVNYVPYEGNPSVSYYTQPGNIDTMNGQLNFRQDRSRYTKISNCCTSDPNLD